MSTEKPAFTTWCGSDEMPTGVHLLREPHLNKGTAFTESEREALGLKGLLPPSVSTIEDQVARVLKNLARQPTDLDRYMALVALQSRNETLFYRVVMDHLEEMMPIIYTPTVGEACQRFGHIYQRPRGLYITIRDRGRVAEILNNRPCEDVRIIVVTDGERILGLGDQGANGMGIPIGKLSLYTACAGIHPAQCLPVMLDVGTDNEAWRQDPFYLGVRQHRVRGEDYIALIDEFVEAVQEHLNGALIQFEDFANHSAFDLLARYRGKVCTFNDDIQGTGAVALAGLLAAPRLAGLAFTDQTFLFLGAGEAGIGIAGMIVGALCAEGMTEDEARRRCWFVDSRGLVVQGRDDLAEHKKAFAHSHRRVDGLLGAIEALSPTALIGVSGQPGTFTPAVLKAMASINDRPIIMALSNPTSRAECTAEEAYFQTDGQAIFASGSPFPPVSLEGQTFVPGQGNNAYIFPGVGLGVIASRARLVTDEMFAIAAKTLAEQVGEADLALGRVYPPLTDIFDVSAAIAVAVAEVAYDQGLARVERPADLPGFIREQMYRPEYPFYV